VRSHAKASTAGSTQRQATGLGRIFRGALATRGASPSFKGSGAPKARRLALPLALFVSILSLALWAGVASAVAPTIVSSGVSAVTSNAALLEAEINPEGEATTYHFEYGLADCSSNPCTSAPAPDNNVGSGSSAVKVTHEVEGLAPATTYHFRVVATNGSGPSAGPDRTFTTYAALAPNTNCPNQAFRSGPAANLPDCRAYEMVSPLDKNGGDITTVDPTIGTPRRSYNQSSLDGDKLTFSAGTSFAGSLSSRNVNQYIASRGASGWTTQGIDAPLGTSISPGSELFTYETWRNPFRLFTPDLSTAWFNDQNKTPLTPDAGEGVPNLYRRNSDGTYQALTAVTAENVSNTFAIGAYDPEPGGHSADFSHIAFSAPGKLTPDAAAVDDLRQAYVYADGELHLVSVRPSGLAHPQGGRIGWALSDVEDVASVTHAVSDDGSRIYWTASGDGPGIIYLRQNPDQPQSAQANGAATGQGNLTNGSTEVTGVTTSSGAFAVGQTIAGGIANLAIPPGTTIIAVGASTLTLSAAAIESSGGASLESFSECTEPAKACTLQVSKNWFVGLPNAPRFWTAAADGSKMFYTEGGVDGEEAKLYEFDLASETSTLIAGETSGVLGASDDASSIYFDSAEVLDAGAVAGQPNLYLYRNGTFSLIGTVAPGDVGTEQTPPESIIPGVPTVNQAASRAHASRVSPDGGQLVFESVSPALAASTGYDNADALNGKPSMEVYLYDATANGGVGRLSCISCNPSGVRPVGQELRRSYIAVALQDGKEIKKTNIWAAAWIQTWIHPLYHSNVLSEDGDRVYFNSFDALVPRDTNGAQDVYQWEAPGTGGCSETSSAFSAANDGCVSLISTGAGADRSEFVDASPDGSSVFFETSSSIDPRDPGLLDIYAARVNGGFPLPTPSLACEGEGCQSAPPPPIDATPASASFKGAGNPAPRKARRACRARKGQGAKAKRQAKRKSQKRCRGAKRGAGR
jgi:hypothetical protein